VTESVRGYTPLSGLKEVPRSTLYLLGLVNAVTALAMITMANALATGIVSVIDGDTRWQIALAWGVGASVARAAASWAHRVIAARTLLGAKERLRSQLAERVINEGETQLGATTIMATRGLDELDKYFTVFLPALVSAACIPLLVGARILFADWPSALVIVVTVPLIPVFMALIGMHTHDRVAAATESLGKLSNHLVELARGLPVLIGLGRAAEQAVALRKISDEYRVKTVQTLRTAFLSSLALELIATISVALVAVVIGVRLVSGTMSLELGLLALILAPECFTPFRDIGAAFHSSEDGREALGRVRRILDGHRSQSLVQTGAGQLQVTDLSVRYADRARSSVENLSFTAPCDEITVLDGPSGSGKSTVLGVLAGSVRERPGLVHVSGTVTGVEAQSVAWMPQHPHIAESTVLDELLVYAVGVDDAIPRARDALVLVELGHLADADPNRISPGELRRLAFARVLMRVEAGARLVLLDEPTAHLDARNAATVTSAIARMRGHATVIIASHDAAVRGLATYHVALSAEIPRSANVADDVTAQDASPLPTETLATAASFQPQLASETQHPVSELVAFLAPIRWRLVATIILGVLAATFAVALTALSGWLIVRASQHPPIMYLMVAIVGVRFFGIGRAVLRYSERLVSHDAVFAALTELRMRLWHGLSLRGSRDRSLLTGANALDRLVRDADQVRDLSIRTVVPLLVGALTAVSAVVALGIIYPPSIGLFVTLAVVATVIAPWLAVYSDRAASRAEHIIRSQVLRRFAALVGAGEDLRSNTVDGPVRRTLRDLDVRASAAARRGASALGLGSALTVFACCSAAVLVLPLTARAVANGTLAPEWVAVLALTPLGLIDPFLELVAAVQQWPAFRHILGRVSTITGDEEEPRSSGLEQVGPIERIELEAVSARWPGMDTEVFSQVSASVQRGDWLVITGPSGSGKSTLLTLLLGYLRPSTGRYLVNRTDTAYLDTTALRRRTAWCPQEGHLFNSTLRGNLLLARSHDDTPRDDELRDVLDRVGLSPLLGRMSHGLETRIGSEGSALSGGERQRLAVARTLLTRSEVILIDEPTAHLDEQAAGELMTDLRAGLKDHITVLVTHHPQGILGTDRLITLGGAHTTTYPDTHGFAQREAATKVS
jgi:ATP-binding cassette subfamily C protein CydCD